MAKTALERHEKFLVDNGINTERTIGRPEWERVAMKRVSVERYRERQRRDPDYRKRINQSHKDWKRRRNEAESEEEREARLARQREYTRKWRARKREEERLREQI